MTERRETSRYPLEKACFLNIEGRQVSARVENLSRKGGLFRIMEAGGKAVTNEDLGRGSRSTTGKSSACTLPTVRITSRCGSGRTSERGLPEERERLLAGHRALAC